IGFKGVENRALSTLDFPAPRDVSAAVHAAIQRMPPIGVTGDEIRALMEEVASGLTECEELAGDLMREFEIVRTAIERGEPAPPNLQTGLAAFYDVELQQHPIFEAILAPLCAGKARALARRSEEAQGEALATLQIHMEKVRF